MPGKGLQPRMRFVLCTQRGSWAKFREEDAPFSACSTHHLLRHSHPPFLLFFSIHKQIKHILVPLGDSKSDFSEIHSNWNHITEKGEPFDQKSLKVHSAAFYSVLISCSLKTQTKSHRAELIQFTGNVVESYFVVSEQIGAPQSF